MNRGEPEALHEQSLGEAAESGLTADLLALHGIGWDGDLHEMRDDRHRLEGFDV